VTNTTPDVIPEVIPEDILEGTSEVVPEIIDEPFNEENNTGTTAGYEEEESRVWWWILGIIVLVIVVSGGAWYVLSRRPDTGMARKEVLDPNDPFYKLQEYITHALDRAKVGDVHDDFGVGRPPGVTIPASLRGVIHRGIHEVGNHIDRAASASERTIRLLLEEVRDRGVTPCAVDVSEFMTKGGGSVKCMVLNLGEM